MRIVLLNENGFNLIEVLAMLAIIGVMFAVAVQFIPTVIKEDKIEQTQQELKNLRIALLEYYKDTDMFPNDPSNPLRDLEADSGVTGWDGPYIRPEFEQYDYEKDEWDEDYQYAYTIGTWGTDPCLLYSKGPNKQDDAGSGDDIPVNPGASSTPEKLQVNPAQVKKEIERLVKNELTVIQQKGVDYDNDRLGTNFPDNIDELYAPSSPPFTPYLFDESYRTDWWQAKYISIDTGGNPDEDTFISKGPDGSEGTNDDIYP